MIEWWLAMKRTTAAAEVVHDVLVLHEGDVAGDAFRFA
jgi:hypothetical protein